MNEADHDPEYYMMNPAREAHLQAIKDKVCRDIDLKYRAGQAEHGGNVWERDMSEEIRDEVTDLAIYTAIEELKKDKIVTITSTDGKKAISYEITGIAEVDREHQKRANQIIDEYNMGKS